MKSILFITAGDITWASSRLRCYWPAEHIPGAECVTVADFEQMQDRIDYAAQFGAVVFQKTAMPGVMQPLRARGVLVAWDLCDPLHWFSPKEAETVAAAADIITVSTDLLGRDFTEWSGRGVFVIPDRLRLDHYDLRDPHTDTSPVKLIWYGLAANRPALFGVLPNLDRLHANGIKITLTVMDDAPEIQSIQSALVEYRRWSLDTEAATIRAHDIALLPPYPGPWGLVKSNNRNLVAWASGVPDTTGLHYAELYDLTTSAARRNERAAEAYSHVCAAYDVRQTAADWGRLLC